MAPKVRKDALHEDFTRFIPQDGTVQTVQDYVYYPDWDQPIRVVPLGLVSRQVLKLERYNVVPDDMPEFERIWTMAQPLPPINLYAENQIRIECEDEKHRTVYSYRTIRHVTPGPHGSGWGIVTLMDACNADPVPGKKVKRIEALAQHYIDDRIYDGVEKGKIHLYGGRYYSDQNAKALNLPLF